ncbi:hypothetical protein BDQ12DRAFT_263226 [Crucibulum laeve]|uniref:Uncharacterized protein n=1 Tax=Crucibulum laeve TaxID=68775 RepID=A0A5C3LTZ8_9AGAR|nr:hypothetical protein BDQ12DRAFT_263226 [Crucibulum laeve]
MAMEEGGEKAIGWVLRGAGRRRDMTMNATVGGGNKTGRDHSTSLPQQQRHSPAGYSTTRYTTIHAYADNANATGRSVNAATAIERATISGGHRPPLAMARRPPSSMGLRPPPATRHHPTSSTGQRPPRPRSIPNPEPVLSPEEIAILQRSFSNLGWSSVNLNRSNANFFSNAASIAAPQHRYNTHPLQTLRHTASRLSINLDDGPGNEIHPTIVHDSERAPLPSTMSHRSVARLPENFIPVMDADGTFTLPPPHEVRGPIMAPIRKIEKFKE